MKWTNDKNVVALECTISILIISFLFVWFDSKLCFVMVDLGFWLEFRFVKLEFDLLEFEL